MIEIPNSKTDRACVMIHGAGVAGQLTYEPMLEHLNYWRWVLVPDLNGMGESYFQGQQEAPVTIESLSADIQALLAHLNWQQFDLIGYSLGGLVALHVQAHLANAAQQARRLVLMEPASLERECEETLAKVRQRYRKASQTIRETGDVELGIAHFMDGVSPNRRKHPVAEQMTQSRLAHRPIGFSYALDAVTDWAERVYQTPELRTELFEAAPQVLLFSGALSHELLRQHYDVLAERYPAWQHVSVSGCDHSLPFQKPRQIARHVAQWLEKCDGA
nr:alpha/beta hydrolase [Marinomonas ostreistagni]